MNTKVKHVVIVGGGSAGWMAAAMLSRLMGQQLNITLIESPDIATVGVGEATIPPLQVFNQALGISEPDFIKATQGTFKLGIEFENWYKRGDSYMHAFGQFGKDLALTPFHHYWLKSKPADTASFWDYSLNYQAAKANRFTPLATIKGPSLPGITHAYHFDATLYAALLSERSQQQGVTRIAAKVGDVHLNQYNGFIDSLTLENGQSIKGDLFIDCSGFKGLLIEEALKTGYDDYSHWLLCDSALAVPCKPTTLTIPYTRSIAHQAGWRWRIPLQHRTGNGIVYSSQFMSDEQAQKELLDNLDNEAIGTPKQLRFTPGRRLKQWHKNCVSLGLSSGFLEPLESTSLHLIQSGLIRLIKLFPTLDMPSSYQDEYNRQSKREFEQIRDFIILHYRLNQHQELPFWRYCQTMAIPESLREKIELFEQTGNVFRHQEELFSEAAWVQVMLGQGIVPQRCHPLTEGLTGQQLSQFLSDLSGIYRNSCDQLPSHDQFIHHHCRAPAQHDA
ncbi:tryptophan halogenase [Shewanella colwelliana]|uniref:Tryptophan halogenase n=1 Tax=Shewanella colwelliana TaxID=23 RepID=A0A1E5IPJ3_SHECO|nr:tryptophan halogenase family protein [Shewanella colwelliana]OEG72400.1 tryptophan halogenase [Shewanella colwelliana]